MAPLRLILLSFVAMLAGVAMAQTPIRGVSAVDAETMTRFVSRHNPDFDPAVAEAFVTVGERYGIRGDIALCLAVIETGWFKFGGGTAVTPDQHNYCGMGVTSKGSRGCTFASAEEGVTALIQHLFAYCCDDPLPDGETVLDPRFGLVARGVAPCWEDLSGRWAMNPNYAVNILKVYASLSRLSQNSDR